MPFDNCILTENFSGSPCRNCDFMAQAGTGQGLRRLWNWYTNEDGCWYLRVLVCYSRPGKCSGKADWGQPNLNLDVPWWLECCYDLIHWRRNMWAFDWSNLLINKCASPVYISNCCWNWWKSKYSVAIEIANSLLAKNKLYWQLPNEKFISDVWRGIERVLGSCYDNDEFSAHEHERMAHNMIVFHVWTYLIVWEFMRIF